MFCENFGLVFLKILKNFTIVNILGENFAKISEKFRKFLSVFQTLKDSRISGKNFVKIFEKLRKFLSSFSNFEEHQIFFSSSF